MSLVKDKIKVLITDDSALMRKLISAMLSQDAEIEVVATAMDGILALKKIEQYQPDVITLDIIMPNMDGLTTLEHIVARYHLPVIIVSSLVSPGAEITLKALELGAVDFVAKPKNLVPDQISIIAQELVAKIKAVANYRSRKILNLWDKEINKEEKPLFEKKLVEIVKPEEKPEEKPARLICIGISTGGPEALSWLLPKLPKNLAAAVLVVQHMPEGFTAQLAQRLNKLSSIPIKEAADGDLILASRVLIAPGGRQMYVKKRPLAATVVVSEAPPVSGHCPSVDVLFASAATEYGDNTIGVIMTGMGEDGVIGLGKIKQAGGLTLAQDEASCVVFGMPKVALAKGYVNEVVSLEQIPDYLVEKVGVYACDRK
jgi:two-component system, chemotaxis family, protein-glutamate methylesterase/glutaminase